MRERWPRLDAQLVLTRRQLTELIQPAFPGERVVSSSATLGGRANTNTRLELSAHRRAVLLRLYTRAPELEHDMPRAWAKEAALHRLLAPRLPVPEVFFVSPDNPVTGHPYMLRDWAEGDRLDLLVHGLDFEAVMRLAFDVGAVLAGIHAIRFGKAGFLDDNLEVVPFPPGVPGTSYADFLRTLLGKRGAERLGPDLFAQLVAFAEREDQYGASWSGPPCLVHSDFGGSNIVAAVQGGVPRVAAVVDWEFAFSSTPFIDFGNLLRPPLGDLVGFDATVARGYRAAGGLLPDDWRRRSLYEDMGAWAAFLGRPRVSDIVIEDARNMIARTLADW